MPGSFQERARYLESQVGDGDLEMGGTVHQPYAAAVHNRLYYRHPRGGQAGYLEGPFTAYRGEMLQHLANNAVVPQGSNLDKAARENAEKFADWVREFAPVEFRALKESTNVYVKDNGVTSYYVEQKAPYNYKKE